MLKGLITQKNAVYDSVEHKSRYLEKLAFVHIVNVIEV